MVYRKANVFVHDTLAGILQETDEGFSFRYDDAYLQSPEAKPVSLTLPLTHNAYVSPTMFPFFDGLLPEGWLLEEVLNHWKLQKSDRFGVLCVAGKDPIGAVHLEVAE